MNERCPQHIQNIVLRDYCTKMKYKYLLSGAEYAMNNSYLMLKQVGDERPHIDGIVAYSLFQLPSEINKRNKILKQIIKNKKTISFAVEQVSVSNLNDIDNLNSIWEVKKILPGCLN